jgi:SAM-dependent methyltransferase
VNGTSHSHDEDLFNFLIAEANHPFSGWDFSHISKTDRMVDAPLTWSYASKILPKVRKAQSLLDMGTGGGELLSSLQPLPPHTCATEGYEPNIPVARQRLEPLGVTVYEISDDTILPFAEENQFDLIINRHESYSPQEVLRTLKPGSQFITQQVGGENSKDLNQLLGAPAYTEFANWNLAYAVKELADAGFIIREQLEDTPITRFFDVGAIVYYLKAIPWQIPDFSVEQYFERLLELHTMIQQKGFVDVRYHRFFIVGEKPV